MGNAIHIGTPGVPNRAYDIPVVSVDKYFLLDNNFSDVLDAAQARTNLGIDDLSFGLWGSIVGDIADQDDLVAALALKSNVANPTFTGTVTIPDLQFSILDDPFPIQAKLSWNATAGTLILGMKGGYSISKIGEDQHIMVINKSGYRLYAGDIVYVNGSNSGLPAVFRSMANDAATSNAQAMVTEGMADNATGYVYTIGTISGLNTVAFSVGTALYLSHSSPGEFTATAPTSPNYTVPIGFVSVSDEYNGSVFFIGNKPNSTSNFIMGGSSPDATHNVLVWDNALQYWKADNNFNNWNTAYSWGNHAGLYAPIASVYTLPMASATVLGGIKIGTGLSIDVNGVVTASGGIGGMIYPPDAGLAKSSGGAWVASIADNSANWNTAYGWGNHASAGYTDVDASGLLNRVAIFKDTNTLKGDAGFTYNGTNLEIIGNVVPSGDVYAYAAGSPGGSFWDAMPHAAPGVWGAVLPDDDITHFLSGKGTWITVSSGTMDHNALSNKGYAASGHTGFLPDTHLTDFTHANIANGQTAFGWGNHAGLYTPIAHNTNILNPHSVTKTQVGLGNVTNESKATMFTSPTFTGTTTMGALDQGGANFSLRDAGVADSTAVRLFSAGGSLYLQNGSGDNIIFRSKTAVETMRLANGGNLTVAGDITGNYDIITKGRKRIQSAFVGMPNSSGTTDTGHAKFGLDNLSWAGVALYLGLNNNSPYEYWLQARNPLDFATNRPLILNPNGGNVGVNTGNPGYALEVGGAIHSSGNITSHGDIIAYVA